MTALFVLLACGAKEAPTEAPEAAAAVESEPLDGAALFAVHCASCHGDDAGGDGPLAAGLDPAPADLRGRPRDPKFRGIPRRTIIEEGSAGSAMPAFKALLSAEELEAVYGFVHALHHGQPGQ